MCLPVSVVPARWVNISMDMDVRHFTEEVCRLLPESRWPILTWRWLRMDEMVMGMESDLDIFFILAEEILIWPISLQITKTMDWLPVKHLRQLHFTSKLNLPLNEINSCLLILSDSQNLLDVDIRFIWLTRIYHCLLRLS